MNNEDRDRSLYKYPGTDVLRNKLNLRDAPLLEAKERLLVTDRIIEGVPSGTFDLDHLKAIHKHLFQDVYEWAGNIRQTDIRKSDWFHPHDRIETGMTDIHKRLGQQKFLKGLSASQFAEQAGVIIGDVNFCHPFREGNGRTQFQYLKQLSGQAGHPIDLAKFSREDWINASVAANRGEYDLMSKAIQKAMQAARDRGKTAQDKTAPRDPSDLLKKMQGRLKDQSKDRDDRGR